jgi:hypothetical protein
VLRKLIDSGPLSVKELEHAGFAKKDELYRALDALEKEFMVAEKGGIYSIRE